MHQDDEDEEDNLDDVRDDDEEGDGEEATMEGIINVRDTGLVVIGMLLLFLW